MNKLNKFFEAHNIDAINAFTMIIENNDNSVVFFKDSNSKIIYVNKNFFNKHPQFVGHEDDVIGKTDFDLFPNDLGHAKQAFEDEQNVMKNNIPINIMESEGYNNEGQTIIAHTRKYPLQDRDGNIIGIFGITEDITKEIEIIQNQNRHSLALEKLNKELTKENTRDSLSGLFNRRYLRNKLEYLEENYQHDHIPYSIIIMDVDNFKEFNDLCGHNEGDRVIEFIGKTLLNIKNTYYPNIEICRLGGDEFLIILPNYHIEETYKVATKIRDIFHQKQSDLLFIKELCFSMGVAEIQDNENISALIEHADKNLYKIKQNGKNNIGI